MGKESRNSEMSYCRSVQNPLKNSCPFFIACPKKGNWVNKPCTKPFRHCLPMGPLAIYWLCSERTTFHWIAVCNVGRIIVRVPNLDRLTIFSPEKDPRKYLSCPLTVSWSRFYTDRWNGLLTIPWLIKSALRPGLNFITSSSIFPEVILCILQPVCLIY